MVGSAFWLAGLLAAPGGTVATPPTLGEALVRAPVVAVVRVRGLPEGRAHAVRLPVDVTAVVAGNPPPECTLTMPSGVAGSAPRPGTEILAPMSPQADATSA
jgi:hypothetical protein